MDQVNPKSNANTISAPKQNTQSWNLKMSVTFYRMIRFKKFQFVLITKTKELCLKCQSLPRLIVFSRKRDSQATFLFFLFLPKNQKDSSGLRQHFMVATFCLKQFFTLQNRGFITVELTYFPFTLFLQRNSTTVLISVVFTAQMLFTT